MSKVYLECPCCGGEGATADDAGLFYDQQPLTCGCPGWVCVEEDDEPWISVGEEDDPCPHCDGEQR